MPSFAWYFVASLLSLPGVLAHYKFTSLILDGVATGDWQYVRYHTNDVYPIRSANMTSNDMRCNVGAVGNATSTASVEAGATVGFTVDPSIFHSGVLSVYMARAPNKVSDFDGSGDVWFKIYEVPPILDGGESITFPTFDATEISFSLPSSIEEGEYLLRIEHLALHLANYLGKAEFYIGCAQIAITGGGTATPTKTVAIPGAYASTDPNIYLNIYTPVPTAYVMPGPPIGFAESLLNRGAEMWRDHTATWILNPAPIYVAAARNKPTMIGLADDNSKFDNPYDVAPTVSSQLAGSEARRSGPEQPPPFEAAYTTPSGSTALQFLSEDAHWIQDGGEQPPEFTPYEAEHWVNGDGDIISHDPHLNEDGEALYRFLLSQAIIPPKFAVRCRGTHTETRTRTVTHVGNNHHGNGGGSGVHTKTETYTETVVDFDFSVDISQNLMSPVNWTVADNEPAYRGSMVREIEVQDGFSLNRHHTTRKENKAAEKWREFKGQSGYPPWVQGNGLNGAQGPLNDAVVRSSRTFRQWADEYCASDKLLKEFVFEKVVYGWNIGALQKSIETLIKSTYYTGNLHVTFSVSANKIYIRPTNKLSRAVSHWWVKLLLWITFIYPFIWLFKRFSKRGGGMWRVAGAAYPLKDWVHLEDSVPGQDVAQYLMLREESQSQTLGERLLHALPSYGSDRKHPAANSSTQPGSSTGDTWADRRPTTLAQIGAPTASQQDGTSRAPAVPTLARLRRTQKGISELVGLREGEWFKQWEGTIMRSVMLRVERQDPLVLPGEVVAESAGAMLDGFHD